MKDRINTAMNRLCIVADAYLTYNPSKENEDEFHEWFRRSNPDLLKDEIWDALCVYAFKLRLAQRRAGIVTTTFL